MSKEKLLINNTKGNNSEVMRNSGDCKNCNSHEEKQVKEIASLMCRVYDGSCDECGFSPWCCIYDDARNMYNAGHRKQSDGEWSRFEVNSTKGYGQVYYQHKDCDINATQLFPSPYHFCPNCGAKMRKEDEGK